MHALADADWAGDRQSRKSVSGSMILHGKHLIKAWTKQQSIVATSTAKAELYAGNHAATESMGVQAFAKDLVRVVTVRLHIGSGAALSIIRRTGLSKAKHIEIQHLWLQEAVRSGNLTVEKIPTETKFFGPGNKALDEREIRDVDEARELLLCVNKIQVRLVLELSSWIGNLAHFQLRSRGSDRDPRVYRTARRSPSRAEGR